MDPITKKLLSFFFPKPPKMRYFELSFPSLDGTSDNIILYSLRSKKITNIVITIVNDKKQKYQCSIPEIPGREEKHIGLSRFLNSSSLPFEGTIKKVKIVFEGGTENFIKEEETFIFTG